MQEQHGLHTPVGGHAVGQGAARGNRALFAGLVASVVVVDQLTKWAALEGLADGPVQVGPVQLRLVHNDGSAFGLAGGSTTAISLVALAVTVVVGRAGWRSGRTLPTVGYGLVASGAVGNLVDRAARTGEGLLGGRVVDFVDIGAWPVFNVADSAITVGAALLVLCSWHQADREAS